MTDESICLDSPESAENTYVVMLACNELLRQKWQYDPTVSFVPDFNYLFFKD